MQEDETMKKMSINNTIVNSHTEAVKNLREIPGIGPSIANDLIRVGIHSVQDLKGKDPDRLYDQSNANAGCIQDRCLLYVFREAVYYAETPETKRDSWKLKWWNWKD
ncbi:MAG: helix-hairpin-helix domain-containing protein [Saprospiraceae bacterium]